MKNFNQIGMREENTDKLLISATDLNIVFDGDSLTFGIGATSSQDYPDYIKDKIESSFNTFTFNSFGVSGQNTQDMIADAVTQIDPLVNVSKYNLLVGWEDVNAILNDSRTAQQNFDDFQSYYATRRAAGFDYLVHVVGYYPRLKLNDTYNQPTWNDTLFDIQEEYRELCRNAVNPNWDILVDLTINPVLGGQRAQYVNNFFFDSVHLTTKGYDEAGEWILQNGILQNFKVQ